MKKWLVALALGLAALSVVYVLKNLESKKTPESRHESPTAVAPGTPADGTPEAATDTPDMGSGAQRAEGVPLADPNASAEGVVTVDDAWAKTSSPGRNETHVYMLLTNTGSVIDQIAGVTSPNAAAATIHETVVDTNNKIITRPATHVDLEPGVPLVLEPGGLHITLTGLSGPLKAGDTVTVVLQFARSGRLQVEVPVGEQPTGDDSQQP